MTKQEMLCKLRAELAKHIDEMKYAFTVDPSNRDARAVRLIMPKDKEELTIKVYSTSNLCPPIDYNFYNYAFYISRKSDPITLAHDQLRIFYGPKF